MKQTFTTIIILILFTSTYGRVNQTRTGTTNGSYPTTQVNLGVSNSVLNQPYSLSTVFGSFQIQNFIMQMDGRQFRQESLTETSTIHTFGFQFIGLSSEANTTWLYRVSMGSLRFLEQKERLMDVQASFGYTFNEKTALSVTGKSTTFENPYGRTEAILKLQQQLPSISEYLWVGLEGIVSSYQFDYRKYPIENVIVSVKAVF